MMRIPLNPALSLPRSPHRLPIAILALLAITVSPLSSSLTELTIAQAAEAVSHPPTPDPVSLLPAFAVIESWEERATDPEGPRAGGRESITTAVDALCRFYGTRFNPSTIWTGNPSPLEWPRIFADQDPDSRRQRVLAENLMRANGLSFRPIVALESGEAADSIKIALATQTPVLYNTPGTHVVFGYDTREPDHWWWVWQAGRSEIVLESERVRRFVSWDDHPAANLIWVVTGLDTIPVPLPQAGSGEWRLLEKVDRSVVGDAQGGIRPYPLSMRDLTDRLQSSGMLPVLAEPVDSADPIGVLRAIRARERVVEALERLVPRALDTTVSTPLRVAQYHYHSAIGSLQSFAMTFYGPAEGSDHLESLNLNWGDPPKRRTGVELLRESLKRERDAHEAIVRALAAHEQGE